MLQLITCALALVLTSTALAEQKIYKTVDKDGNVVFTDVPQGDKGTEVQVELSNTFEPVQPARPAPAAAAEPAAEPEPQRYARLAITAPSDDLAVRDNAGNLTVTLDIDPELNVGLGHRLQLLLDGVVQPGGSSKGYALVNVDRGTHALVAQVVDADGAVVIASAPVTFHMLRYHRPPARPTP